MTGRRHCEMIGGALVQIEGELTTEEREALATLVNATRKSMETNPVNREDCRHCATSEEDCKAMRDAGHNCCDRCRHPVVRRA